MRSEWPIGTKARQQDSALRRPTSEDPFCDNFPLAGIFLVPRRERGPVSPARRRRLGEADAGVTKTLWPLILSLRLLGQRALEPWWVRPGLDGYARGRRHRVQHLARPEIRKHGRPFRQRQVRRHHVAVPSAFSDINSSTNPAPTSASCTQPTSSRAAGTVATWPSPMATGVAFTYSITNAAPCQRLRAAFVSARGHA